MTKTALVTDACIMITFGNASALHLLTGLRRFSVVTPERAVREVSRDPARTAVQNAVSDGSIAIESIDMANPTEQASLQRFDSMPAFRNRADAEVLALVVSRGGVVCSDELAIRRVAVNEIGTERVAGTLDVLVWAVREDRLAADDAEALLPTLDVGPMLVSTMARQGVTFGDLLSN